MPARTGVPVPSLAGYVGENVYVDLVSMLDTIRGNQYLLTAEDSFNRFFWPKCLWTNISMSMGYQTSYSLIMVKNL